MAFVPGSLLKAIAAVVVVMGAAMPRGHAQNEIHPTRPPWVLEIHSGWKDPLGYVGLALVYDRGGRFSAGVGAGLDSQMDEAVPTLEILGRLRLLRHGPLAFGLAALLSRGTVGSDRRVRNRNALYPSTQRWAWNPAYRAAGAATAEWAGDHASLRLEAGLGVFLNGPACSFPEHPSSTSDCNAPENIGVYDISDQPSRAFPFVTVSLGYRFGVQDAPAPVATMTSPQAMTGNGAGADSDPAYRSPKKALGWALGGPLLGLPGILLMAGGDGLVLGGAAVLALGLSIGPSAGHIYAGENGRALGMSLLRLAAIAVAVGAYADGLRNSGDCSSCDGGRSELYLALAAAAVIPVSMVFDWVDAPKAARRSNARHGLTNLSLVPLVVPHGPATGRGMAVSAQF